MWVFLICCLLVFVYCDVVCLLVWVCVDIWLFAYLLSFVDLSYVVCCLLVGLFAFDSWWLSFCLFVGRDLI